MLSVFPTLLSYSLAGPFILRIVLGATLLWFSYQKISGKISFKNQAVSSQKQDAANSASTGSSNTAHKSSALTFWYGLVEGVLAILILIGLFTQIAAVLISILLIAHLAYKLKKGALFTDGVNYYVLLLAIALSLIVSGAGFYAFDLPL